jgi:hypothetical protein
VSRDLLRRAAAALRELEAENERLQDELRLVTSPHESVGAVIGALKAERDRLREALEMMLEMIEMNGFGKAAAIDTARAALEGK